MEMVFMVVNVIIDIVICILFCIFYMVGRFEEFVGCSNVVKLFCWFVFCLRKFNGCVFCFCVLNFLYGVYY